MLGQRQDIPNQERSKGGEGRGGGDLTRARPKNAVLLGVLSTGTAPPAARITPASSHR